MSCSYGGSLVSLARLGAMTGRGGFLPLFAMVNRHGYV